MQTFEPEQINRLFLKQLTNLTRFDTVYVAEDTDGSQAVSKALSC